MHNISVSVTKFLLVFFDFHAEIDIKPLEFQISLILVSWLLDNWYRDYVDNRGGRIRTPSWIYHLAVRLLNAGAHLILEKSPFDRDET